MHLKPKLMMPWHVCSRITMQTCLWFTNQACLSTKHIGRDIWRYLTNSNLNKQCQFEACLRQSHCLNSLIMHHQSHNHKFTVLCVLSFILAAPHFELLELRTCLGIACLLNATGVLQWTGGAIACSVAAWVLIWNCGDSIVPAPSEL